MLSFYSNLATHLCIFFFCFSSAYITNRNISVTEADVRYVMSCYCCDTRKQLMKEMARMSYWNPELEEMMVAPRWFPTWQLFLHHQLHGHLLFHFETIDANQSVICCHGNTPVLSLVFLTSVYATSKYEGVFEKDVNYVVACYCRDTRKAFLKQIQAEEGLSLYSL